MTPKYEVSDPLYFCLDRECKVCGPRTPEPVFVEVGHE